MLAFMAQIARGERDAKDLRIINRRAKRLNREAADVLTYQVAGTQSCPMRSSRNSRVSMSRALEPKPKFSVFVFFPDIY